MRMSMGCSEGTRHTRKGTMPGAPRLLCSMCPPLGAAVGTRARGTVQPAPGVPSLLHLPHLRCSPLCPWPRLSLRAVPLLCSSNGQQGVPPPLLAPWAMAMRASAVCATHSPLAGPVCCRSQRTKKAGITGKYGVRYGASLRKQVKKMEISQHSKYTCVFCGKDSVKRTAVGIWSCGSCGKTMAGGAYTLNTAQAAQVTDPSECLGAQWRGPRKFAMREGRPATSRARWHAAPIRPLSRHPCCSTVADPFCGKEALRPRPEAYHGYKRIICQLSVPAPIRVAGAFDNPALA